MATFTLSLASVSRVGWDVETFADKGAYFLGYPLSLIAHDDDAMSSEGFFV